MKIAVDAMGGDFAPEQIVFGAIRAAKKYDCEIVLVGDEQDSGADGDGQGKACDRKLGAQMNPFVSSFQIHFLRCKL